MTDETTVNLPEGGTVEVSPDTTPKPPAKKKMTDLTPTERKEYNRLAKQKSDKKKAEKSEKDSKKPASLVEVDDEDAIEILRARGLRHPRVLEVCVKLARIASEYLKVPFNAYLFSAGLQNALAVKNGTETLTPAPDVWEAGQRTRLHEQWAMWDYSMSWREQADGTIWDFEKFKEFRRMGMVDPYNFGRQVLKGMEDLQPEPHERWFRDVYIQKNPDLLPENYDLPAFKKAFAGQSEVRQRLLVCSRGSFKSTTNLLDEICWVLTFPSIRLLCVSATKPLAKGFLSAFRSYWMAKPHDMSLFAQLYPEYMTWPGEEGAKTSFTSPMRRLDRIQPTFFVASLDTEGLAGERFDYLAAEDLAEINNSSTPEMRQKTLQKVDLIRELGEPYSAQIFVGTPTSQGQGTDDDPGDIYTALLARENMRRTFDEPPQMHYVINPCWTLKEGVNKLPYDPTLTPDEVDLLFPAHLTFKVLMKKLKENVNNFRQQHLCSWLPPETDQIHLAFDYDLLVKSVVPIAAQPVGEMYLLGDVAYSNVNNKYADNSALAAVCIHKNQRGEPSMCVFNMEVGRMRGSEFAMNIIKYTIKYQPRKIIIEKGPTTDLLQGEISRLALAHGINVPIYWAPPSNQKGAKVARLKALEMILVSGRLGFLSGAYIDTLFAELTKLDGRKSSALKKDDQGDALSIGVKYLLRPASLQSEDDTTTPQEREEEQRRVALQQMYDRTHGSFYGGTRNNPGTSPQGARASDFDPRRNNQPPPEPTQRPMTPREQALSQLTKCLPSAMRRRNF